MIQGLLTALGTTAGKVSVGVALTATAASGAVATDLVELPLVNDPVEESPISDDDFAVVNDSEGDEQVVETDDSDASGEEVTEDPVDGDEDGDEDEANHGQTVSEFARTTDLEGCEKGQAIAELASSKAADRRNNPEREHDPCAKDGEDEPEVDEETEARADDEDIDDEDETDEDETDEDETDEDDDEDESDEDETDDDDDDEVKSKENRGQAKGRQSD